MDRCIEVFEHCEDCYVFVSKDNDIHFNLAVEKFFIEDFDAKSTVLFLWKNNPVVVIGRYQNPWEECRLTAMEENGVALARRCSGGGAVYQDLGNICFTIISPANEGDKARNFGVVLDALDMMGVKASLSGRNDVLIDGRKVSGSAFQTTKGRFCHHGTMLVSTDLTKLSDYLTPDKRKLESHGVKSVSSRVANFVEFLPSATTDLFASCMVTAFTKEFCKKDENLKQCPINLIDREKNAIFSMIEQSFATFSSKEWNLGKSPSFTDKLSGRFFGGGVTFYLNVKKGIIEKADISSDTLSVNGVEELKKNLVSLPYDVNEIKKRATAITDSFASGALELLANLLSETTA